MRAAIHVALLAMLSIAGPALSADLQWRELPPLPNPDGVAGPFVGLHNDALIVAGGANFPKPVWETTKVFHDQIYVLLKDPKAGYRWVAPSKLDRPIAYGASVSTAHGIVCIGGNDATQTYADVFLLRWNPASESVETQPLPSLPFPCANSAATSIGEKIYVAGGTTGLALDTAQSCFLSLDLSRLDSGQLAWEQLPSWPGPPRAFAIAAAQFNGIDDSVYVISGRRLNEQGETDFLADVYEFTPGKTPPWRRRADAPRCVMAGTGIAIGQSHIFILSGADGSLFNQTDTIKDAHPGFPKEAFAYHTITNTWTSAGPIPANQVTTTAVRWGDDSENSPVVVASGEVRPRVRTPQVWEVRPVRSVTRFGRADFSVLVLYLSAMVGMGIYFAFRNKNADDFFRGGQRVPWFVAGLSIFATMLSSITFMAIPAKSYATDWVYFLVNMTAVAVAPFVIWLFLPFFRKVDAVSAYQYLEKRFNRFARQFASASFILFQLGRTAVVLYLPALALKAITPLSEQQSILLMGALSIVYCALGGLEAVAWTDAVQSFVLLGGALFSLVFILTQAGGGLSGFFATAAENGKFHMIDLDFSPHSFMTTALWVVLLGGFAQNMVPYSSDMSIVQRYMSVPDTARAKKAIWTNAIACIPASTLFFGIGTALFVFYSHHPERLDPTFKTDAIFPLFISRELPLGVPGLVVAGLFAAAQSTIATSINSMSAAVVEDFMRPWRLVKTERGYLFAGRFLTVALGSGGVALALLFASSDIKSLWNQYMTILGLFGGSLCGLFCLGIFTTRANGAGAIIGAVAGAAGSMIVKQYTDVHFLLYPFIGIATCFAMGYLSSLAFPQAARSIRGLTLFTFDGDVAPDVTNQRERDGVS